MTTLSKNELNQLENKKNVFPGYYPGYTSKESINNLKEQFDPNLSTNLGPDQGISNVGFRVGKYNPQEWHENNYRMYYEAFSDLNNSEHNRWESNNVQKETESSTNKKQLVSSKKLKERLHDISFWKTELRREIEDLDSEIDYIQREKKRLINSLNATTAPLHISSEILKSRELHRYGIDRVVDDVDIQIRKEINIINNVQHLLRKTIDEADNQIRRLRHSKHKLEQDWSNKYESERADNKAQSRTNNSKDIMYYPGSARYQEMQSTTDSWEQNSHDNIVLAENERMLSNNLRMIINNILSDISKDMREQADNIEISFAKRIEEIVGAKTRMEKQLENVLDELTRQENNIIHIKKSIKEKESPLKAAQTRLNDRSYRPEIELCRDKVHSILVEEVLEIYQSVDSLIKQLTEAENNFNKLNDDRLILEKEINLKTKSIYTDKEKCVQVRSTFPKIESLLGY